MTVSRPRKSLRKRFFKIIQPRSFSAGSKAVDDVNAILERNGYLPVRMDRSVSSIQRVLRAPLALGRVAAALLARENLIVIQSPPPFEIRRPLHALIRFKRATVAVLIHDIEAVHDPRRAHELQAELAFLGSADAVVCHNPAMGRWLRQAGLTNSIYCLGFFDYLISEPAAAPQRPLDWRTDVVFAGNLAPEKSGFIYQLPPEFPIRVHVFGARPDPAADFPACVDYAGKFPPDSPAFPAGVFGLVWDGPQATCCCGVAGDYLKLNSPHKASLYLASGAPIICWRHSALAREVEERQLGLLVESLLDVPALLGELPQFRYEAMLENVRRIRRDICGGRQLGQVLTHALEELRQAASSGSAEGLVPDFHQAEAVTDE